MSAAPNKNTKQPDPYSDMKPENMRVALREKDAEIAALKHKLKVLPDLMNRSTSSSEVLGEKYPHKSKQEQN
jgi:hypothetical protein